MRRLGFVVAVVASATLGITVIRALPSELEPRPVDHPAEHDLEEPGKSRYVIAAAGDIVCPSEPNGPDRPTTCQHDDTATLIERPGIDEVLLLGDNQYERGSYAEYTNYFEPTWGRAFANISPSPGNHEYDNDPSATPRGYFRYFGALARGPDGLGYYAFDLGSCPDAPCWHVISLNSELCFDQGGCGPASDPTDPGRGNRMYAWLEQDLASHPDAAYPCTLAYWHHPLFSFSTGSGGSAAVRPLWHLLYEAGADVVLAGHSHNYQRWWPQDPAGDRDRDGGIRQFVVGTGGSRLYELRSGARPSNLAMAQDRAFGVLRLVLRAESYRWAWVTAAGQPAFEDASERAVRCVRAS
jgi:hypothetical protein